MKEIFVSESLREEPLAAQMAFVEQGRQLYGVEFARSLWVALGLPTETVGRPVRKRRHDEVDEFIRTRLIVSQGDEVQASILYQAFLAWRPPEAPRLSITAFGRAMMAAGMTKWTGRVTYYINIRLSPDLTAGTDLPLFAPSEVRT